MEHITKKKKRRRRRYEMLIDPGKRSRKGI
jgi:hypothetical protein